MDKKFINNNLGSSFELLKTMAKETEEEFRLGKKTSEDYASAYGSLRGAISGYIRSVSGESIFPHLERLEKSADDISRLNIFTQKSETDLTHNS